MERNYDTFQSRILERQIEYLWFGHSGRPLIMFPTSGGRFHENEDRGLVESVGDYVAEGRLQVCCIDAYNEESWNNNDAHPSHRLHFHDRFDHYLSNELVPMVVARAGRDDVAVYGASLGAYHAANFAGRHPDQVKRCIAFSGLFDANKILDGHWEELAYYHSPVAYISNMDDEWRGRIANVEWVVATGEHDSLVEETRNFANVLRSKDIPVHSEVWPGVFGHDWPFWEQHLRRFLP